MKRKIGRKRRAVILTIAYLAAAAVTLGALAGVQYARAQRSERALSYSGEHAFYELVTAAEELDAALEKCLYATSPRMVGQLMAQVQSRAAAAQTALSALPFATGDLERLSGYFARVGDYANALAGAAYTAEEAYAPETLENLRQLSETAGTVALNLAAARTDISEGLLLLSVPENGAGTVSDAVPENIGSLQGRVQQMEREFPELPSLIYDGPFSEHLAGTAPKALEGLEMVSEADARDAAADFLGLPRSRIVAAGESGGEVPCWHFTADAAQGATSYVSVTKQGGRVIAMLCSRPVGSPAVDAEAATETAARFLRSAGYRDMAETYHMTQGNILTVNYAYRQGDVICYSDLVKVSVALDTGKVCGFEAKGYLSAHTRRDLPEAAVSAEDARAAVPESLTVIGEQPALIPSDGQYETLCRELKCEAADGRHYILYVNAVTGAQEKILILLEDDSGVLTR